MGAVSVTCHCSGHQGHIDMPQLSLAAAREHKVVSGSELSAVHLVAISDSEWSYKSGCVNCLFPTALNRVCLIFPLLFLFPGILLPGWCWVYLIWRQHKDVSMQDPKGAGSFLEQRTLQTSNCFCHNIYHEEFDFPLATGDAKREMNW